MPHPEPPRGPEDDSAWNVPLDEDFIRSARFKESELPGRTGGGAPRPKRVWPRNLALAVGAGVLTALGYVLVHPAEEDGTTPAAATPTTSATTSATATATASSPASLLALDKLFPAKVTGSGGAEYTLVASKTLDSCVEGDSVGPRLIQLIRTSAKGCLAEQIALYTDAQHNQYNLAVFTMNDQVDTARLVTELAMAYDDYQVGVQAPPPGSGLPTLSETSGLVQSFTGTGRATLVGMGQWADGRSRDYQELVDQHLTPLQRAVSKTLSDHENAR